jgi:hypothetical protein
MWLVALTEKPFCRIPFRRVTMRADAGSLDLDALFFLCRHTVTFFNTSEHGMWITTSNVQCHQSSLGSSSSGSVCYVSEPQAGHFRFSSSRSSNICCRRNVNLLETLVLKNVTVCLLVHWDDLEYASLPVESDVPSKEGESPCKENTGWNNECLPGFSDKLPR